MERGRDRKNLLIGSLIAVVLIMSVGFALFSQALEINSTGTISGSWSVKFKSSSLTEVSKSTGATVNASTVSEDKLSATFSANLTQPGDYAEYYVEVENTGSINAVLDSITLTPKSAENTSAIKFSYQILNGTNEVAAGNMTGAGTYNKTTDIVTDYAPLTKTTGIHKVIVRFDYLSDASAAVNAEAGYTLVLNYNQATT
jgi:hypothetical protein